MNTNVLWYENWRGAWSQNFVEWLTVGCTHHNLPEGIPWHEGAVVVVKADACHSIDKLNETLRRYPWVLLFITSNEEGTFRTDLLRHHRLKAWLQTPGLRQGAHRYFPWGWTPCGTFEAHQPRALDWFFAGQVTHLRRTTCVEALKGMPNGLLLPTDGFGKGLPHKVYCEAMRSAKMVPCPSGPITVDSFRVCEALELGAIPILDTESPCVTHPAYWNLVFDSTMPPDLQTVHQSCTPLPFISDWHDAPQIIAEWVADWDARSLKVWEWWRWQKVMWNHAFEEDIKWLTR